MKYSEFRKSLSRQGATLIAAKGSHLRVYLNGQQSVFPDVPEAATSVHGDGKALRLALEALESALEFYFEDRRTVPMPSLPKRRQKTVILSASISAKVLLLNEMIAQNVRPADLARKLGTTPQAVDRLTKIRHATKIDGLGKALQALGKRLEMKVV